MPTHLSIGQLSYDYGPCQANSAVAKERLMTALDEKNGCQEHANNYARW